MPVFIEEEAFMEYITPWLQSLLYVIGVLIVTVLTSHHVEVGQRSECDCVLDFSACFTCVERPTRTAVM